MLAKLKQSLLLRFIPQRTMIGLGLGFLALLGAFEAIAASDFCSADGVVPSVCGFVAKAIPKLTQFLIIIGIADRKRQ